METELNNTVQERLNKFVKLISFGTYDTFY